MEIDKVKNLLKDVPLLSNSSKVFKLDKGWSVVWAIPFGKEEVKAMLKRAEMIFFDYEYFDSVVPEWFTMQKQR